MLFHDLPQKRLIKTATLLVLAGINWLGLSAACATVTHCHTPPPIQHLPRESHPPTIRLEVVKIAPLTGYVTIRLWNTNKNKPVLFSDLREMHTQKIHLLIIDENLDDYHHVHPRKTRVPGEYEFIWHPNKKGAHYRIWADIVSSNGQQEYLLAELTKGKKDFTPINQSTNFEKTISGYRFQLSFKERLLSVGKPSLAKIEILDSRGKPVRNLQPVMGSYAHIVGFYDDFRTILHAHPMGKEPSKASDRGGSLLSFHLEPQKAGFVKLFVQVKIHDKMLFVPFGLYIFPR